MSQLGPGEIQYMEEHANQSLQPNEWACFIIGYVLAVGAVTIRFFARRRTTIGYGMDDWFILAAMVPFTGYFIAGIISITLGEGKHIIFVHNVRGFIEVYITAIVAYSIGTVLTKTSILCFYNRIFPRKQLKWLTFSVIAFTVAYNLALIFVAAFECIPLSALWSGKPGRCIDTKPPYVALGIVNIVTDVFILAIPIKFVIPLQMDNWRKLQVIGIFLTGALVCVFGIVRVVVLSRAQPDDPSYNQTYSGIWSYCEMAVGAIAACLPTMGMYFSRAHLSRIGSSARYLVSSGWSRSKVRPADASLFKSDVNNDKSIISDNGSNATIGSETHAQHTASV